MIELGEVAATPGDEPGAGRRPVLRRSQVRKAGIAGIVVLCLLAVTGSARPQPHGVRPLWSIPAAEPDGMMLTRDAVYSQRVEADSTRLTAYDVADGTVRWTRQLPGSIGFVQAAADAGLLLVPTLRPADAPKRGDTVTIDPLSGALVGAPRETVALDARTGAERWRVPGEAQVAGDGTALMLEQNDQGDLLRLRLIRLGDHGTIWSRDTPGVQSHTIAQAGARPTKIITASGNGDIKIYRYADGAYLAGARIPWVTPRPEDGFFNDITADDGFLVVNHTRQDTFDARVYRLDTLAEAWHIDDTNGYAFFCGAAICLNSGAAISAHDPANGRRLWQLAGAGNFWPIVGDRLVRDDGSVDGRPLLVDAGTGHQVGAPAQGSTLFDYQATDALLLLHKTTAPPGRTSVTRWDLRTGRQHLLGSVAGATDNHCQVAGKHLACQRNGMLEVSRIG